MQKGLRVPSRKIPHTYTSWSDCMICFLYWVRFLTLQYMRNMYASFHSLPWAPPKSFIRNREKWGDPIPWWGIIYIGRFERIVWGEKFHFHLKNLSKNPRYFAGRVWLIWFFVLVLKNCDKEVWIGWSAMKKDYTRKNSSVSSWSIMVIILATSAKFW